MSDTALMAVVLVAGGVVYLAVFFWITAVRVREIEGEAGHQAAGNPGSADEHGHHEPAS